MKIHPPIDPDRHGLHDLLTRRGLTAGWLNTDDGDPYGTRNITRHALGDAIRAVPRHYRSAVPEHQLVGAWADTLAEAARTEHVQAGTAMPSVQHGRSLLLLGITGVGKTYEAYGAIRHLAASGVRASWTVTTAADLYAALRPRAGIDAEAEFAHYRDARLLLVDDLGAAKSSEFTEEINFRLVNHRYEHERPTLFTSNVLPAELSARVGDRVASRLAEMCDRVVLTGSDRRRETQS
ncbi:ATP-binding protein [Streptomyces sp. NPDC051173]|uniref:ATP-binding protein n=1 Tax=Streptomyces sp. NPDC051173 TaxID=3155164 RepID=UPI003451085B